MTPAIERNVIISLSEEEWAWLDVSAAISGLSDETYVTSLLREMIRDDVAEERKAAS